MLPERPESMPIRIFVADDHDIVREGVKSLLKSRPEWTICGEASDGIQAASLIGKIECDIAILDISMPGKSGLEVAASVSRQHPGVKILIFTMHSGKTLYSAAREAGAHGVVQKSFAARDLVLAIEALIGGGNFFPKDSTPSPASSLRSSFGFIFFRTAGLSSLRALSSITEYRFWEGTIRQTA
jgi:DNA-binding NarL/FixJ family response regulator